MKFLIVGIDGGDERIFDSFDMPFLQQLRREGASRRLVQHPFERGWVSMLTGRPAAETRGLFMQRAEGDKPELQFRCTLADMISNPDVVPLWRVALDRGNRVGFMNVPTTYPAPSVDGFFVSGAGGGLNKVAGIPESMVYPRSTRDVLARHEYIVDYRFGTEPIRDFDRLFERLSEMHIRRSRAFVELCAAHQVDFGFVAHRATTVIQYMAMSEIAGLMTCGKAPTPQWSKRLQKHYRMVDDQLQQVFQDLAPEHWLVTSDHGAAPYLHNANLDVFLVQNGYMRAPRTTAKSLLRGVKRTIVQRRLDIATALKPIPYRGRRDGAKAFGNWYLPGIYVNDARRFGGPVAEPEVASVVDEICAAFNDSAVALRHSMCARPYRGAFEGAPFYDDLPDIWVDAPDSIFFDGRGNRLVSENLNFRPLLDLDQVAGGMYSGQKRREPMFLCDAGLARHLSDNDPSDLRLVYLAAARLFAGQR
jgi:predicted AlkP superfamily phosphohydrolase/phosphomutase